jgi:3-methyladenine DNA glycosylase AlkD
VGKRVALALIARRRLESKIAGIALLSEPLGDHLRAADIASFAALLAAGHLDQPNLIDWFATKVIGPLLEPPAGRAVLTRWLVEWAGNGSAAHRRCACHAVLPHAHDRAFASLILLVCGTAVWSVEPTDQAIVGLLLKQLAHVEPRRVEVTVRRIAHLMSKACIRTATERFPVALRTELLVHWKRATRIRR